jgi:hypothetical protein
MERLRGRPGEDADWSPAQQDDDMLPLRTGNEAKDGIPLTSLTPLKGKASGGSSLGKYNREWTVLAFDAAAVLFPLATLALVVAILLLDGEEVDTETFGYWRNAIIVVSHILRWTCL